MLAALVLLLPGGLGTVAAAERISGPVEAELVRVIDGDTIKVRARIWPGLDMTVSARIRGIDAPEIRGKCPAEKADAAKATARLAETIGRRRLRLFNIEQGKWSGRVIADVATADGHDLGALMLKSGFARPYDGHRRPQWCVAADASAPEPKS